MKRGSPDRRYPGLDVPPYSGVMREQLRMWFDRVSRSDWPADVALGLTAAALNVTGSVFADPSGPYEYNDPNEFWLVVLSGGAGLALIVRRKFPVLVLFAAIATLTTVTSQGWQSGYMPGTLLFASYAVGAWAPFRRGVLGLAGMYACMITIAILRMPFFKEWVDWGSAVIFTLPWVLGAVIRRRRLEAEQAISRALELERERAVATERAVAAERMRMARELHDVVTHTLSVIAVQSTVARHLLGAENDGARNALRVIEDSSRVALDDLRRMLGLLRNEGDDAALDPAPGLAELELLASAHRATHGPVELEVDPRVEDASASLRLTAFRLVQEGLTNIGKHAPGSSARVTVRPTAGGVLVQVEDDGQSTSSPETKESGYGLAGMQERVALFGGTMTSGPKTGGGFQVRAELRSELTL